MKASIIVPAFNEDLFIQQCIDSLLQNNYKNKEIIVVNDGSTDNTINVLAKYDSIKVINIEKRGMLHAIKTGVKFATGEIVIKIDADSIAPFDWVTKMVEHFNNPEVVVVGGTFKNSYDKGGLYAGLKCLDEIYHNKLRRRFSVCMLLGANWAIRSYLLNDQELYENKITDEGLLLSIIESQKGKVIFDKQIFVTINSPKNIMEIWRRKYLWGKRAVADKMYKNKNFWTRPLYFTLLLMSFCFIYTTLGKFLLTIVSLPLIALMILSISLHSNSFLFTPFVFLISEFAFVYGNLTCFIKKNLKFKLWK
jgi:cellulose synthase/poly-beta-1,6-N-acetylglucosamine synthase-like glycosyltransferase